MAVPWPNPDAEDATLMATGSQSSVHNFRSTEPPVSLESVPLDNTIVAEEASGENDGSLPERNDVEGEDVMNLVCSVSVATEPLTELAVEYADTDVAVDTERLDRAEYTELPDKEAERGALAGLASLLSLSSPSILKLVSAEKDRAGDFPECVGDDDRACPLDPNHSVDRPSELSLL